MLTRVAPPAFATLTVSSLLAAPTPSICVTCVPFAETLTSSSPLTSTVLPLTVIDFVKSPITEPVTVSEPTPLIPVTTLSLLTAKSTALSPVIVKSLLAPIL